MRARFFHLALFLSAATLLPAQAKPAAATGKEQLRKLVRVDNHGIQRHWLDEDVRWIITDEERQAFERLANDEERDQFIEQFWRVRDPTPDTFYNEFQVQHYRRIVAANERFGAFAPGWKTDRGRIYITYGRPDRIESIYVEPDSAKTTFHVSGPTDPPKQSSTKAGSYPAEVWSYRYLENVGQEVHIEFVDTCGCGRYKLVYADAGTAASDGSLILRSPSPLFDVCGNRAQSEGGRAIICIGNPPKAKFKDLEEIVVHKISVNLLPFAIWIDSVKATCCTDLVTVFIEFRDEDVRFASAEKGLPRGRVNIHGRLVTLTGRVAEIFENSMHLNASEGKHLRTVRSITLALRPGLYRLDLAVQDVVGNRVGTLYRELVVPEFGAPTQP